MSLAHMFSIVWEQEIYGLGFLLH